MKRMTMLAGLILLAAGLQAQPPYDPERDTLLTGKVVSIVRDSTRPEEIRVEVVTPHGDTVLVHLGPGWFLHQRMRLRAGDTLWIEGSLQPGEMVARRIRGPRGSWAMELRTREGFPLWMKRMEMRRQGEADTLVGRVVGMREVLPDRGFYPHMEVALLTPEGETLRVMLGPTWMVRERVRMGDSLRCVANPVDGMGRMEGRMAWMARMMENMETGERMMFRDERGMPMWDAEGMDMGMGMPMQGQGGGSSRWPTEGGMGRRGR